MADVLDRDFISSRSLSAGDVRYESFSWAPWVSSDVLSSYLISPIQASTVYYQPNVIYIRVPAGPRWFHEIQDRLWRLASLPSGWDSYASDRISARSLTSAATLLWNVMREDMPIPSIMPSPDGGVVVEWRVNNVELSVDIDADGRGEVYFEDFDTDESWEADLQSEFQKLLTTLPRLLAHR
jgi:hypothetical protein